MLAWDFFPPLLPSSCCVTVLVQEAVPRHLHSRAVRVAVGVGRDMCILTSFLCALAEPRVRILHPAQRSLELPVLAPGHVELRCELSVPDAAVRWFKDGLEVDETHNLRLLADGAWRCLLIPRSSAEDTGEYICESKDEAVSFNVKVTG